MKVVEEKTDKTRIFFAKEQTLQEREKKVKSFRNHNNERSYLLSDDYERIRMLTDLMLLEGMTEEFIGKLLTRETDQDYALTLDFLHSAALIMGEDYVKENLIGKCLPAKEAAKQIRICEHEKQMKPYQEIYSNMDERLAAAREGEQKTSHQLEILKLQSSHAEAMYKTRMESARMQFRYELRLSAEKAAQKEGKANERIASLENELSLLKKFAEDLKKENAEQKKENDAQKNENNELREELKGLRQSREKTGHDQKADALMKRKKAEQKYDWYFDKNERRSFCFGILADTKFTGEQLELLLPCLEDKSIPLSMLRKLCNPELPAENMKTIIKYIQGGVEKRDEKE